MKCGDDNVKISTNIFLTELHSNLCFMDKIVKTLDKVPSVWYKNSSWKRREYEHLNPIYRLLARPLSAVGALREQYYSGELSRGLYINLIRRKGLFFDSFFKYNADL